MQPQTHMQWYSLVYFFIGNNSKINATKIAFGVVIPCIIVIAISILCCWKCCKRNNPQEISPKVHKRQGVIAQILTFRFTARTVTPDVNHKQSETTPILGECSHQTYTSA